MLEGIPAAGWAAITAGMGAFFGWLTTRSKSDADVAAVLSETSIEWIRELRAETARLRVRLAEVEVEVIECEQRHERLAVYLRKMGLEIPD